MSGVTPDRPAILAGLIAAVMLVGGAQLLVAVLRWFTS